MKSLNFVFKVIFSLFLVGFAVWYQNIAYNIILTAIMWFALRRESIVLFRFPRQAYFFSFFLLMMFLLQAFAGYGKIILALPFGLAVTDQGLYSAGLFVSHILLIFFTFGLAIYTTDQKEVSYLLNSLDHSKFKWAGRLQRLGRIGMYSLYLLPKTLGQRSEIIGELKDHQALKGAGATTKAKPILEKIYQFVFNVLKQSEMEFAAFLKQYRNEKVTALPSIWTARHLGMAVFIIAVHAALIWDTAAV